jgi:hypothetical protein
MDNQFSRSPVTGTDVTQGLTDDQRDRWDAFVSAEQRGVRAETLEALRRFIDELLRAPEDDWQAWARSFCANVVDSGTKHVVRQPLFDQVLFPALLTGMRRSTPGCARWLAGLSQNLYGCPRCMKELGDGPSTWR